MAILVPVPATIDSEIGVHPIKMKQVLPQRNRIIPNKTQSDNRDNKKETQLPDATTVQDRPMKNKCVIGNSNMRGLATNLKSKLTNPESVSVYKTSGMKIAHLTTRPPGYVNEDTEAVIIYLGTNDIGDQANKAIQDINGITKQMTALHNTHFYFSEIPPSSQNNYNT